MHACKSFIYLFIYVFIYYLGNEAGTWYIDLKNGKGAIGKGEPSQPADAILTMDSNNFFAMFSGKKISKITFFLDLQLHLHLLLIYIFNSFLLIGKLKPVAAFMTGKLNINGNLQKAMKLEKLMNSLKSKL
jgi:putative sterol carrier protein